MLAKTVFALNALILASPAMAQAGTSVPEPSDMLLLGMGVLGLILGLTHLVQLTKKDTTKNDEADKP